MRIFLALVVLCCFRSTYAVVSIKNTNHIAGNNSLEAGNGSASYIYIDGGASLTSGPAAALRSSGSFSVSQLFGTQTQAAYAWVSTGTNSHFTNNGTLTMGYDCDITCSGYYQCNIQIAPNANVVLDDHSDIYLDDFTQLFLQGNVHLKRAADFPYISLFERAQFSSVQYYTGYRQPAVFLQGGSFIIQHTASVFQVQSSVLNLGVSAFVHQNAHSTLLLTPNSNLLILDNAGIDLHSYSQLYVYKNANLEVIGGTLHIGSVSSLHIPGNTMCVVLSTVQLPAFQVIVWGVGFNLPAGVQCYSQQVGRVRAKRSPIVFEQNERSKLIRKEAAAAVAKKRERAEKMKKLDKFEKVEDDVKDISKIVSPEDTKMLVHKMTMNS